MAADKATWAEIERAYVESDETIPSIAKRFGVGISTIQANAVRHDWPRRKGRARRPHQSDGVVTVGSIEAARNDVARRLYGQMSQRLTQMEQGKTAAPPAAEDPDDRMLTQLIRQFEKLTGLDGISQRERGTGGTGKGRQSQSAPRAGAAAREQQHSPPLDAERMRREIVERLERLHAERLARRDPD